ncbi:OmpA family protein [Alisedimentitalea sp. MJ-SS2]|uniref:OmpA family protein n=1 Tax=Aliisedimentitalea sp. MJ-SS2 TaxID=3049795 RepID=UPI00290FF676|nr:OmpA family protein [Alisedimentitalea sp. MJ-SS2]MDU8925997.1 OmpA family protein [Alisedimentitalea sp. MJ-SS2]
MVLTVGAASAQQAGSQRTVKGEEYIPTIWVDPDGCEHWVMDDGIEGYMTPHTNRQGIPVCRRSKICGVLRTDQYFASNSARISPAGKDRLREFFATTSAKAFVIEGHTDSRASDRYNINLSQRRANAVANVAQELNAEVADVRGFGERRPIASNRSATGMAKNRRVEIICLK